MLFTSNLQINKNFPAVLYDATETSSVWHEDRELSGARYHAVNAKFDDVVHFTWSLVNSAQPAYATVQNTDGSTGYLYMPTGSAAWTTWQGAGQPASYYAVNYGMIESDTTGAINTPALAAAIAAAIADPGSAGAIVHIPAGAFNLNAALIISDEADKGLIITGASGGTQLIQTSTAISGADIFQINTWTGGTGVRFKDLYLSYAAGAGKSGNYAVNVNTSHGAAAENVTCERVYFDNCPGSFRTGSRALQCGLSNCTIDYANTINDQNAVSFSGSQDFVRGCVIRQSVGNSPSGCTAIQINSVTQSFVSDVQISDFQTGIQVTEGAAGVFFSNVHIDAFYTAVAIAPSTDTGKIYGIQFSNCHFRLQLGGGNPGTSGVTIGTAGGGNSNVASIFFDSCDVIGFGNAGIEIDGGQDIVITGGQYSSNGQSPSSTYLGAGIAVAGGAHVIISGSDCSGVSYFWQDVDSGGTFGPQPYGIAISGGSNGASDILITGCDLNYNSTNGVIVTSVSSNPTQHVYVRDCDAAHYTSYTSAVTVTGNWSDVQVTNCSGYNDQGVLVASIAPVSGANFSGASLGYFGPVLFGTMGNINAVISEIALQGHNMQVVSGAFTLPPGSTAYATLTYSGGPTFKPAFTVIGQ